MRDISLHLMDIMQNSVSAKADRIRIEIEADRQSDCLKVLISDNGSGMDENFLKNVTDPFVTSRQTRKVGLGIPLLMASAERADGGLTVSSEKNKGTIVSALFKISHIDRLPLGDVPETITSNILANPEINYELTLQSEDRRFDFSTIEIKDKLGNVPITEFEILIWLKDYINDGIKFTFGGVLNEVNC